MPGRGHVLTLGIVIFLIAAAAEMSGSASAQAPAANTPVRIGVLAPVPSENSSVAIPLRLWN
jgi:hypothetical protein